MGGIVQSFLESWALIKFYICSVVKFKICHYKACVVGVCSCVWWSTTEIQLYTSPLTLRFPLKSLWSGLFPNNWSHILHLPGLVFRKSRFSFVACSLTPASPAPLPAPQCRLSPVTIIFLSPWGDQGEAQNPGWDQVSVSVCQQTKNSEKQHAPERWETGNWSVTRKKATSAHLQPQAPGKISKRSQSFRL